MQKHPTHITYYDLNDLATQIGNLRYDALANFLNMLSQKIAFDAEKDEAQGRLKLAKNLYETAQHLADAEKNIAVAWKICEPFTK